VQCENAAQQQQQRGLDGSIGFELLLGLMEREIGVSKMDDKREAKNSNR